MVPSSAITVAASGERLLCGGFFLGETICLGKFDFIADYFRGLSLFRRRGDSVIAFMVSTHRGGGGWGASSPRWAMTEVSTEEFVTPSSGDRGFGLPSPKR
jgi:hypothetical protein